MWEVGEWKPGTRSYISTADFVDNEKQAVVDRSWIVIETVFPERSSKLFTHMTVRNADPALKKAYESMGIQLTRRVVSLTHAVGVAVRGGDKVAVRPWLHRSGTCVSLVISHVD